MLTITSSEARCICVCASGVAGRRVFVCVFPIIHVLVWTLDRCVHALLVSTVNSYRVLFSQIPACGLSTITLIFTLSKKFQL